MTQAAVVMGRSTIGMLSLANLCFKCRLLFGFGAAGVGGVGVIVGAPGTEVIAGVGFGLRFSFSLSFPTDFSEFLLTFVEAKSIETVTAGERKIANIRC